MTMDKTVVDKFQGKLDRFKGITVSSVEEPCGLETLGSRLESSLAAWRQEGVRAVWFHVGHDQSHWVPVLVSAGFRFHHANPDRLALLMWIGKVTMCHSS